MRSLSIPKNGTLYWLAEDWHFQLQIVGHDDLIQRLNKMKKASYSESAAYTRDQFDFDAMKMFGFEKEWTSAYTAYRLTKKNPPTRFESDRVWAKAAIPAVIPKGYPIEIMKIETRNDKHQKPWIKLKIPKMKSSDVSCEFTISFEELATMLFEDADFKPEKLPALHERKLKEANSEQNP